MQTSQTKASEKLSLFSASFNSEQEEKVMLLLHIEGEREKAHALETECSSILQQSLIDASGEISERFDAALKELNGLFKGFIATSAIRNIHAIVAVQEPQGMLHLSHADMAEAYLVRSGSATQITEYSPKKTTASFVHISSGELQPGDSVICSTQRLLRTVTPAQLAGLVQSANTLEQLVDKLESEGEQAALAVIKVAGVLRTEKITTDKKSLPRKTRGGVSLQSKIFTHAKKLYEPTLKGISQCTAFFKDVTKGKAKKWISEFQQDLQNPAKKKKAHFFLVAGILAVFILVWLFFQLMNITGVSQTKAELQEMLSQAKEQIEAAETKNIKGDLEGANALLKIAEEQVLGVMNHESNLLREDAYELSERIRSKREDFNNIIRLSPRSLVNVASENPNIVAQGLIGLNDGEFIVYDRQDLYRVLLNAADKPDRLTENELILQGVSFARFDTLVFQTTANGIIETIAGQPTSMKTEDVSGWITGNDIETFSQYLYILSPEKNQIFKYQRLSNRYSAPLEYNISGDLRGAIDMTIDGSVYVLKEGGDVVKLFRGEVKPFNVRLGEEDLLATATKIKKVEDGNFYFLDPPKNRVIVLSAESEEGASAYIQQYVLEGSFIGTLTDLYINKGESHLYVLDEKRIYVIDLDEI